MSTPFVISPDVVGHMKFNGKNSGSKNVNGPTTIAIWQTIRGKFAHAWLLDQISHKFKQAKNSELFVGKSDVKFGTITQNSIVFGVPKQYGEDATFVFGNCTGFPKVDYPDPIQFLNEFFFAGVMSEDLPGDQSRMITTVYRGATSNFIHPKSAKETLYVDMLLVPVPDTLHLFTWDTENGQDVVGFKWVSKDSIDLFFNKDRKTNEIENEEVVEAVNAAVYKSGHIALAIEKILNAVSQINASKKTDGQKHTQRYALFKKTKYILDLVKLAKEKDLSNVEEVKKTKPEDGYVALLTRMCDNEKRTHGIVKNNLRPRARVINGGAPGTNIYYELLQ